MGRGVALSTFFIAAFTLHNTTEDLAILAPMVKRKAKDFVPDGAWDNCQSSDNSGHLDRWLCSVTSCFHSVCCNRGRSRVLGGNNR